MNNRSGHKCDLVFCELCLNMCVRLCVCVVPQLLPGRAGEVFGRAGEIVSALH